MKHLWNWLKKNWSTLLIVVGVIIALGAWIQPLTSEKRGLDVALFNNVELLASPAQIKKDDLLEFVYKGEKVLNLVLVTLRFRNAGNQPIQESDFVESLRILFPSDTRVINHTLTQVQPLKNFSLFQQGFIRRISGNQISFIPTLINPGEIFDLEILTTRNDMREGPMIYRPEEIQFEHKIYGISEINVVPKIATNVERRAIARKNLYDSYVSIRNLFVGMLIFILVGATIRLILKLFYKRKLVVVEGDMIQIVDRTSGIIFLSVVSIIITPLLLLLLYKIYQTFYDALFL